jgi:hypothetical protein
MTNNLLLFVSGLLSVFLPFVQQERSTRQLIVPLAKGGFVAFRNETAWTNKSAQFSQERPRALTSRALVGEKNVVHRLLIDAAGETVFGYDLQIEPDAETKQFQIIITPLDPQFESTLHAEGSKSRIKTLPKAAEPQVLGDGDAFTLDLLVNQNMGVKIIDIVKVSFDRSNLWEVNPRTLPRDFTLEAVELALKDCRIVLNNQVVGSSKPSGDHSGSLIWIYLQGHGRFVFSLTPRQGYDFRKVGVIEDNTIRFSLKGTHYELISAEPILREGGTWNLWVLHDRNYTPLVPDPELPRPRSRDSLEKIDDAVQAVRERAAEMRTGKQTTLGNKRDTPQNGSPQLRLLVGTANRIEELLLKP